MRDHPNHGTKMLAGMWGAKLNNGTRVQYREMLLKILLQVGLGISIMLCICCVCDKGIWERLEMDWSINFGPASSYTVSLARGRADLLFL